MPTFLRRLLRILLVAHLAATAGAIEDDHWVAIGDGILGADGIVSAIATDDRGQVYVGGGFEVIGDVVANRIARWDGSRWWPLGTGVDGHVFSIEVVGGDVYVGGFLNSAGGEPASRIARWDGSSWSDLDGGLTSAGGGYADVAAIRAVGTEIVVAGTFDMAGDVRATNIARWTGAAWQPVGGGLDASATCLATAPDGDLYAGGFFTEAGGVSAMHVARWDGTIWSPLGSGTDDIVVDVVTHDGHLYATGFFGTAGGKPARRIARWDGTRWDALGPGLYGSGGFSLASFDGALHVGGEFTLTGNLNPPPVNVARWDGSSWEPVQGGTDGTVWALQGIGDRLWATGDFRTAGAIFADRIATWDTTTWTPVGDPSLPESRSIGPRLVATSGGNIFVAGDFLSIGNVPARRIAQWDGRSWKPLGGGLSGSGSVFPWSPPPALGYPAGSMAAAGSDLYVSGEFDTASGHAPGGIKANRIARWNGAEWSTLGDGLDRPALVLAISGSDLFAGGDFSIAGGVAVNSIAKWDGTEWSALGDGIDGVVLALCPAGTSLYAGGDFDGNVARWDGAAWTTVGSGPGHVVTSLAESDGRLMAAGRGGDGSGDPWVSEWDGASWRPLARPDPDAPELNPVGSFPAIVTADPLRVVSFRHEPRKGDRIVTLLSEWTGSTWNTTGIDVSGPSPTVNPEWLPPLVADRDGSRIVFANRHVTAGAKGAINAGPATVMKVSPVATAFFLDAIPAIELRDDQARLYFRGPQAAPGAAHEIRRSSDLRSWEVLGRRFAPQLGGIDFVDPERPTGQAYYHAVPVGN